MIGRAGPAAGVLLLASVACQSRSTPGAGAGGAAGPVSSRDVDEARAMMDAGDADGTLARLQNSGEDPEALALQGRAWAKKAESAPLPTPPPPASPLPKGTAPPAPPEFKPEERRAIDLLERAVSLRPDLASAHATLGHILAPHAIRLHEREQEAQAARQREAQGRHGGGRAASPEQPLPSMEPGVDYSPARVAREYSLAMRGDSGRPSVEALISFAVKAGQLDDAELGCQELIRRVKESGEPLTKYGDFLVREKKDPVAAIEQYRQALIWSPGDDATRAKLADIFLTRGVDYFNDQQFAMADAQFAEAAKYIPDRDSPQGRILTEHQAKLRAIRVR